MSKDKPVDVPHMARIAARYKGQFAKALMKACVEWSLRTGRSLKEEEDVPVPSAE